MDKTIPEKFNEYLNQTDKSILLEAGGKEQEITWKGIACGVFLSFFLAIGAPYGNMIIRGSYMALDFSTPGAIFLFLVLIGLLNVFFKVLAKSLMASVICAVGYTYIATQYLWPLNTLEMHSPGVVFGLFLFIVVWINLPLVVQKKSLALNRADLIVVYCMLLIVSALCTMGLSEQILPMLTAFFYYASAENQWAEKLVPHLPEKAILVDDGTGNKLFYEGIAGSGRTIPYEAWLEPLMWWGIFLLALYIAMVSIAVILRRQWMERERLSYPIAQVGLAMIQGEEKDALVNSFFKSKAMWIGFSLPMLVGSLRALHSYNPATPVLTTSWTLSMPFASHQTVQASISFAILGFSYMINANIAAGIWFFHLLSKYEKEVFVLLGIKSNQTVTYGVSDYPFMAYQGCGALIAMVLVGLWVGRGHLKNVVLKAIGLAPQIDDGDEIMSYRQALFGALGGIGVMTIWLVIMGTPTWIAMFFVIMAMLIFIGITRIVAEAGLAALRAPLIAPDFLIQGIGSGLVGAQGVVNLSMTYMWAADIRIFVMGTCATALRLVDEMGRASRRLIFWALLAALLIGSLGAFWVIFVLTYKHGGINLNGWFFDGAPKHVFNNAIRHIEPAPVYWQGLGFFTGGGVVMLILMWVRQRMPWWPIHPIGFPIGANAMMNTVWFSVFLAWLIKRIVLRFGGAAAYGHSQHMFLGLIAGQVSCNGLWLVIDFFSGKVGNAIFWV